MRILVTGGAGHIGSTLTEALVARFGALVTVVDDLSTGRRDHLPESDQITFIQADVNVLSDIEPLFSRQRFDFVFHLAAVVGVARTLANPFQVFRDIRGIENIASLAASHGVARLFFSSSSEVYGEPVEIPLREDTTPINSRLPYAIVKTLGEAWLKAGQAQNGVDYTIFRLFNTYGPKGSEDFVVPKFVRLALENRPIPINGDGLQTRSYCHVDDCVAACVVALERDMFVNDTVNIGSDREVSVLELAKAIIRLTGSRSSLEHRPALAEGDVRRRCPDVTRMRQLLRREPIALDDGLRQVIAHHRARAATVDTGD